MKIKKILHLSLCASLFTNNLAFSAQRLAPEDFNKMYYLASSGNIEVLRNAVHRGLDIDVTNAAGNTGLCIAVKKTDFRAFNTFKAAGASTKHPCINANYEQYKYFTALNSDKSNNVKVKSSKKSDYSQYDEEIVWWPWILGAGVIGGVFAFSGGGGGSSETVVEPDYSTSGIGTILQNYQEIITSGNYSETVSATVTNSDYTDSSVVFLPTLLSYADSIDAYVKIQSGATYTALINSNILLTEGTTAIVTTGMNSTGTNNGTINILSSNGTIGMIASDSSKIYNATDVGTDDDNNGRINMTFTGTDANDTIIGMYADTASTAINYGTITATTYLAASDDSSDEMNDGTILGMALFNFYNGGDLSYNYLIAENQGIIELSTGSNLATTGVSLIGMASYIDDSFLNGSNNPAYAENMILNNSGEINLTYYGTYSFDEGSLQLGSDGIIGMRADASTVATNTGEINISLTSSTGDAIEVAAGMLSVHGAELINGNAQNIYTGTEDDIEGIISITNQSDSSAITYGMLASNGTGTQTGIYDWDDSLLTNYGLIEMNVSNSMAMASYSGGEIINYGVINLGSSSSIEYTGNYGLYGAGVDAYDKVDLINYGTINVYSKLSTALYNEFSGDVDLTNYGTIYVASSAVGSTVYGGNYSYASNSDIGHIIYEAGNSAGFSASSSSSYLGAINSDLVAAVVSVAVDSTVSKQSFENYGIIDLGDVRKDGYGGTYGTSAIEVSTQGSAVNYGTINLKQYDIDIKQYNVGMSITEDATGEAYVWNYGTITVDAVSSGGIINKSSNLATAINYATININGSDSYGMATSSTDTNAGSIFNGTYTSSSNAVINISGSNSVAMYSAGGAIYNYGTINLYGSNNYAFVISGTGSVAEEGTINISSSASSSGWYYLQEVSSFTFSSTNNNINGYTYANIYAGSVTSTGTYTATNANSTIFSLQGGAEVINYGTLTADAGAIGVSVSSSSFTNSGTINVTDSSYGIYANASTITNDSKISVDSGYGIYAINGSTVTNNGTISASNNGVSIYASGSETTVTNKGSITSDTVVTENGAEYTDETISTSSISNNFVVTNGATFINDGIVDFSSLSIDFDDLASDGGIFEISSNGQYIADSLSGSVVASSNMVMGGFEDIYSNDEAFVGTDEGLVIFSGSYMFDASLSSTTDDVTGVVMTMKDFDDIVDNQEIATFLEDNYDLENNENIFNALKTASTASEFNSILNSETGANLYADFARENMAVLRGLNSFEQNRILNDGMITNGFGIDYYRTGKDENNGISGYDTDVYSPYITYGKSLNNNWSLGGTFRVSYNDSTYDEANSDKENMMILASLPMLYANNNFSFLSTPSFGVGFGEYNRSAVSGNYEGKSQDFYYGLFNNAQYKIDLCFADLILNTELNLQGISSKKVKEDDGLIIKADNSLSLEAGVGAKVRKNVELGKNREVIFGLGAKYYYELLDPYNDLSITMAGSPVDYSLEGYNETDARFKTSLEAVFKNKELSLFGDISYNIEEENNIEIGIGARYNF